MTHVTCRLTAKNRDQLRNPTLGNRIWATFTFLVKFVHFPPASRFITSEKKDRIITVIVVELRLDEVRLLFAGAVRGQTPGQVAELVDRPVARPTRAPVVVRTERLVGVAWRVARARRRRLQRITAAS